MKKLEYLFFILLVTACGGSDEETPVDPVSIPAASAITIVDVANFGDARDIQLSFNAPSSIKDITAFKAILVPASKASSFDAATASALTGSTFIQLARGQGGVPLQLDGSLMDFEGNDITEGQAYQAFVLSVSGVAEVDDVLSAASSEFTLVQKTAVYTLANISAGSGGMDADADGNVYMADFGATLSGNPVGTKVFRITPEGRTTIFANGLAGASGNDFDADGNLMQSSITGGTLSKISPNGQVTTLVAGLQGPVGVAVLEDGNMLVCNCGGNTISLVTPGGSVSTYASGSAFNCPNGIDVDANGNAYVANFSDGRIIKITPTGAVSTFATITGGNNGHLLVRGNFIYVVARGANQIYRVTLAGSVSLLAGTGARGLRNGPVEDATFSLPNDLAFSPDGTKIYINDVSNISAASSVISPVAVRVIDMVE